MIQLTDRQYWRYIAVTSDTNRLLYLRLYPTRTQIFIEMFLDEIREKNLLDDATALVYGESRLQSISHRHSLRIQHEMRGVWK